MTTIAALNVPTLLARSTTAKRDVRTNAFFQKKVTGVAAAVPGLARSTPTSPRPWTRV